MKKLTTYDMGLISLFTALMVVGAFLRIPLPIVPLTFQAQFAILAGLMLGAKRGSISVGLYIFIGLIGLPVFSQGGGISYIFFPTFGYIIGFFVAAVVVGYLADKISDWHFKTVYAISLVGMAIIFAFGMIYFYFMKTLYFNESLDVSKFMMSFLMVPLGPGLLKTAVFTIIAQRIKPLVSK